MEKTRRGQDVLDVQCALALAGHFAGDLDGCFGEATAAALKSFQLAGGLEATGALDPATTRALHVPEPELVESAIPNVTPTLVKPLLPGAQLADLERNLPLILNALVASGLGTRQMVAMTLATIRVEAQFLLPVSERVSAVNTSPGGKPFDLYNTRAGLGNRGAPDGANFRGRGFIQLTGRANYLQYGKSIGMEGRLVEQPLLVHRPENAARLLVTFLAGAHARLHTALTAGDLTAARRVVNGGANGLQEFEDTYRDCLKLLPPVLSVLPVANLPKSA